MPLFGFRSRSRRSSSTTTTEQPNRHVYLDPKTMNIATEHDLSAQVNYLQLEISRMNLQIASMKTATTPGMRGQHREELSHQTFSTRDTTKPQSTPRSLMDKPRSHQRLHEVQEQASFPQQPPPPVPHIFVPTLAMNNFSGHSSTLSRDYVEELMAYRAQHSPDDEYECRGFYLQHREDKPLERARPLPGPAPKQNSKRLSWRSFCSSTTRSTENPSRPSKSRTSRQSSSGVARYRTVKRVVVKKREIFKSPQLMPDQQPFVRKQKGIATSLPSPTIKAKEITKENIWKPMAHTKNTNPSNQNNAISMKWPPSKRGISSFDDEVPSYRDSAAIRRMAKARDATNKLPGRANPDQALLLSEIRNRDMELKSATNSDRIGIAPKPIVSAMDVIVAEIEKGVTLKNVDPTLPSTSKTYPPNPLLLAI